MEKDIRKLRLLIIIILILINIVILVTNLIKKNKVAIKNSTSSTENSTISDISGDNTAEDLYYKKTENEITSETIQNITQVVDGKIQNMDENARTQAYFGKYIEQIESNNYSDAYNMLNDEYKNNYFPSLSDFENYAKNTYPSGSLAVNYNSFDRKGEIYVLDVTIYSITNTNTKELNQTVVIRENSINNFKISFSKWIKHYQL